MLYYGPDGGKVLLIVLCTVVFGLCLCGCVFTVIYKFVVLLFGNDHKYDNNLAHQVTSHDVENPPEIHPIHQNHAPVHFSHPVTVSEATEATEADFPSQSQDKSSLDTSEEEKEEKNWQRY